ncbi:MAG TPA: hypothetical protein VF037_02300 [Gemmatimonadales bacterium]
MPWLLLLGLLAVAAGVVVVFAGGRDRAEGEPAGPAGAPPLADSSPEPDSAAAPSDTTPASLPPTPRADTPPSDSIARPDTGRRTPIGDPAALPRPGVTLPRPGADTGARP